QEDHQRIEREKPGRGNLAAPKPEVDRPVREIFGPEQERVALLVVSSPERRHQRAGGDERQHGTPFARVEASLRARIRDGAWRAPTSLEMFGLNAPMPTISSDSATRNSVSNAIMKCPSAMSRPPMMTVRRRPSSRSATSPPRTGVK